MGRQDASNTGHSCLAQIRNPANISNQTVTHQSASSRWLTRKSKHRVWINEIKLYVFCDKYKEANMRRNKAGAFEIHFVSDEGTSQPPLSPTLPRFPQTTKPPPFCPWHRKERPR